MLQYLDRTDTTAPKGSKKKYSRDSRYDLSCFFSLCCSSYWKMPQRFKEFKFQPSNALSNMVLTLRYMPPQSVLLKRRYQA